MTTQPAISIAIATFRRPVQLERLLSALELLTADHYHLEQVLVVDNDEAQSAFKVCMQEWRLPVEYALVEQQNIALARNRALTLARGDYVAFIDDDEVPDPAWLDALIQWAQRTEAAAVFGPVLPRFESDPPWWVEASGVFARPTLQNGTKVSQGRTGNALLRLTSAPTAGFKPSFGLTGGSDYEFFDRLRDDGQALVWCQSAIVHEYVPPERTKLHWIARRAFRGGQVFGRIAWSRSSLGQRWVWFVKRLAIAIGFLPLTLAALAVTPARGMRLAFRWIRNIGQLSILGGQYYQEYRVRE